jgi:hypothetical protein
VRFVGVSKFAGPGSGLDLGMAVRFSVRWLLIVTAIVAVVIGVNAMKDRQGKTIMRDMFYRRHLLGVPRCARGCSALGRRRSRFLARAVQEAQVRLTRPGSAARMRGWSACREAD